MSSFCLVNLAAEALDFSDLSSLRPQNRGHFLVSYPSCPGTVGWRKRGKKKSEKGQCEREEEEP